MRLVDDVTKRLSRNMAASREALAALLELLIPEKVLGSGSNGVVLQCTLPVDAGAQFPEVPVDTPLALKVVSHFWDPAALDLLDCERIVYCNVPAHPNILRVYAQFIGNIPASLHTFLPADMLQVRFRPAAATVSRYDFILV